ncbi:MAG: glycoside hydrolase family 16 protein [Bacteroidales bacterium]|nr:glycoside hydrolase family 16 protein [Bacteroidales bacterium]MDP3003297.1 glycoside hydrolase family 16 protein [Bacteroidales bacterium]
MASLRLLLGRIPSTSKIEQAEKALIAEFEKLHVFSESDQLAKYNELNELVNSSDFVQKKKEIESLQFKNSEEYSKEKAFLFLRKAKDIVLYFKTIAGSTLKRYKEMDGSRKIKDFESLESFINSFEFKQKEKMKPVTFKDTDEYRKFLEYKTLKSDPEIKSHYKAAAKGETTKSKIILRFEELGAYMKTSEFFAKKNMKPITFKDTEEYKKLLEYKRLKGNLEIKEFYKFKSSKEYANYLNTDGSSRLSRFYELREYVASAEFKEKKENLLDKKRFEKTEMFKEVLEYNKLKKSDDILWYFKVKDSNKFDVLKYRELSFSDEFDGEKLDTKKWLTNYYWGEKLLKDRYSVESDLQAYTEKENFELRNSILKINTKPRKVTGKVWSATHGFSTKEFSYTSGLINSGNSFRQKYGVFTAKIKLGDPNAKSAFWMLADKITPHIDICRTSKGKVLSDFFSAKGNASKTSIGSRYSNDFFIYTLEWTSDKLVWKINDTSVFRQTSDVPQEPMYVLLAGGLDKPINGMTSMEIDWVRVYQVKN